MKIKIPENIKKIKNNKIVNILFEPEIIHCVDKFDIKKLNKIDFTKFSTLIINESHLNHGNSPSARAPRTRRGRS